jgi:hypothetical protein
MLKHLDPMWEYGEHEGGFNRQRLNCKLCGKEMKGGITQLKYHHAQIPGREVEICPNASPEIICIANKSLVDMGIGKDNMER